MVMHTFAKPMFLFKSFHITAYECYCSTRTIHHATYTGMLNYCITSSRQLRLHVARGRVATYIPYISTYILYIHIHVYTRGLRGTVPLVWGLLRLPQILILQRRPLRKLSTYILWENVQESFQVGPPFL